MILPSAKKMRENGKSPLKIAFMQAAETALRTTAFFATVIAIGSLMRTGSLSPLLNIGLHNLGSLIGVIGLISIAVGEHTNKYEKEITEITAGQPSLKPQ